MSLYEVNRVAGTGTVQLLVCAAVQLPQPAKSIRGIRKTVLIDAAHASLGNVIAEGRLRAQFDFAVMQSGQLAEVDQDSAFSALIPVGGSQPGMTVVVTDAYTADSVTSAAPMSRQGAILALTDRSVIRLCVRVSAPEDIYLPQSVQYPPEEESPPTSHCPSPRGGSMVISHFQANASRPRRSNGTAKRDP